MTITSTLKVWDLNGTAATKDDLAGDANAERVTSVEHVFSNDSDILVDCGSFRVEFQNQGSSSPKVYTREPITSDSPSWNNTYTLRDTTVGGASSTLENTRLTENTQDKVTVESLYDDGVVYVYTFKRGSLSVELDIIRPSTQTSSSFTGFSGSRFVALADGEVIVDGDENSSDQTSSKNEAFSLAISGGSPWIAGFTSQYKPDDIQGKAGGDLEYKKASGVDHFRQWLSFIPTEEPDQGSDQYFHETFTLSGSGTQTTGTQVDFGSKGGYMFAAAVTSNTNTETYVMEVALDDNEDGTYEHTLLYEHNASGLTVDDYRSRNYVQEVTASSPAVKVKTHHDSNGGDSTVTLVWWPHEPTEKTADGDLFGFAAFTATNVLGPPEQKRYPSRS